MRDTFAPQLRPWVLGTTLFGVFGVLAVLVASVGTYSLTSYAVSHRTREMAIRTALGAARRKLVRLVVLEGLRPVAIGIAAGIALAMLSGRLITSLLYETSPADPGVLAAACAAMGMVATAGCAIPAWRAARIDPIAALKVE
jgi:ABC-type antimicrobial peptide transport system permease subunit